MSKKKQSAAEENAKKTEAAAEEIPEEKTETGTPAEKAAEEKTAEKSAEAGSEADSSEEKTDAKAEELAAMNDRYLRLCAEYDNYRKRSQKEKSALYDDVKASAVTAFLPVYDNLVRALAQPTGDEAYKKGVEMIMAQFRATMDKLGVKEMDCLGKAFDPAFHNAVMHVEDAEKGDNEIVEVFQQGFMLGEKVIRFAMVKVAN